ncbi:MAG: methyltransferase domain-containing protein [Nanoarchaeota archaeon]
MKLLIHASGKSFLVKDTSKDYHCDFGMIKKEDFEKESAVSNKGERFICLDAAASDLYRVIKRGAQIMLLKDLAVIVAECGIDKSSIVLDVGTGSAGSACFLAGIAKKVHTYDVRPDHIAIAKKNAEWLNLKNIVFHEHDMYAQAPKLRNADAAIIDLLLPHKALPNVLKCVKRGGFIATYSPHITQTKELIDSLSECVHIKTIETIQREWEVAERLCRPRFGNVVHTGFVTILRKV